MKTKTKQHRRIYYVPGIIALAIAPIIFVTQTKKYLSDRKEYCLSVSYGESSEDDIKFTYKYLLAKRDYQTFKLVGNQTQDSSILILVENFARGIELSQNNSLGLKVIISQNIKYQTYISLLNSCLKSNINTWIPLEDTLFIFHKDYPKDYNNKFSQNMLESNFQWGCDLITIKKEFKPTFIEKIKMEQLKIKQTIPFAIIILILTYLNFKKIKNEG